MMQAQARVSIIIVNYNGRIFLKDCLESIQASEASGAEVIIVDNASTDGSGEYLKREFPSVKVMIDRNYGLQRPTTECRGRLGRSSPSQQ
jgi:GT2 family glycosyltransferase